MRVILKVEKRSNETPNPHTVVSMGVLFNLSKQVLALFNLSKQVLA